MSGGFSFRGAGSTSELMQQLLAGAAFARSSAELAGLGSLLEAAAEALQQHSARRPARAGVARGSGELRRDRDGPRGAQQRVFEREWMNGAKIPCTLMVCKNVSAITSHSTTVDTQ